MNGTGNSDQSSLRMIEMQGLININGLISTKTVKVVVRSFSLQKTIKDGKTMVLSIT